MTTRPYFAYGSNMDPGQMRERCPGSTSRGAAVLEGYRLIFTWDSSRWRGGVGSIVPEPGAQTWGVLWDITPADEASLDRYELVHRDIYRKEVVAVLAAGQALDALVYVATETEWRRPSRRYLDSLVRGARAHDLPGDYLSRLEAVETR